MCRLFCPPRSVLDLTPNGCAVSRQQQQSGPRAGPWYHDTPRGMNQISKAVSNAAISLCPQFVASHLSDQARPDGTYNWGLYSGRCTATTNLFASGKTPSEVAVVSPFHVFTLFPPHCLSLFPSQLCSLPYPFYFLPTRIRHDVVQPSRGDAYLFSSCAENRSPSTRVDPRVQPMFESFVHARTMRRVMGKGKRKA